MISCDAKLQDIIDGPLNCHRRETEIRRLFDPAESLLPRPIAEQLTLDDKVCYGIASDVLSFIAETVNEQSRTLETGAGKSTLVFAFRGSSHTAITPALSEIELIREFASHHELSLRSVTFIAETSETFLPRFDIENLDFVLLDGKHAFPWPILDWFFTADKLRQGGIMLIDDVQLRSVSTLADFMRADPGWKFIRDFSGKSVAFQKLRASIHDVSWHMQPFTALPSSKPSLIRRLRGRIGREVRIRPI